MMSQEPNKSLESTLGLQCLVLRVSRQCRRSSSLTLMRRCLICREKDSGQAAEFVFG